MPIFPFCHIYSNWNYFCEKEKHFKSLEWFTTSVGSQQRTDIWSKCCAYATQFVLQLGWQAYKYFFRYFTAFIFRNPRSFMMNQHVRPALNQNSKTKSFLCWSTFSFNLNSYLCLCLRSNWFSALTAQDGGSTLVKIQIYLKKILKGKNYIKLLLSLANCAIC